MVAKTIRLFLFNIAVVFLLLAVMEFSVRRLKPEIQLTGTQLTLYQENRYFDSHGLKPNSIGKSNGVERQADRFGFWKYSTPYDPNLPSWLFLGDSATMGIGVEGDSTFAGLIQVQLDSVNVLNPAMIGYRAKDYFNVSKSFFSSSNSHFRIERATIFWCLNDIYSGSPQLRPPGQQVRDLFGEILNFIRLNFKTYQFLKNLLTDRSRAYFRFDAGFYTADSRLLDESAVYLKQIVELARKSDIEIDEVALPYEYQIRNYEKMGIFAPQQILTQMLSNLGIQIYDCAPSLKPYADKSERLYLYGDGIHFSKLGHRKIAEFILKLPSSDPSPVTNP